MEDTRKYFDYELAYKMYEKCVKLLNKGGIDELDKYFEETGDRENGYTTYYGFEYNTAVYITNKNFDNDKENETWLNRCNGLEVTGEVDIYSYGGGDDNLYINNKKNIEERINGLLDYAKNNDYTIEDYEKELESLEEVYAMLGKKSIKFNLDENNNIQSVEIEDINNKVEHYFNEEDDEEKKEYYNSKLRNIIKDYVDYLEENREEV